MGGKISSKKPSLKGEEKKTRQSGTQACVQVKEMEEKQLFGRREKKGQKKDEKR